MPPKDLEITKQNHEIFRNSSIGTAFADSIDERVKDGRLTGEQARMLMQRFDKAITESLSQVRTHFKFKGKCTDYRNCDDVWVFNLVDVTFYFRAEDEVVFAKKVKLVAHEYLPNGTKKRRGKKSKSG